METGSRKTTLFSQLVLKYELNPRSTNGLRYGFKLP